MNIKKEFEELQKNEKQKIDTINHLMEENNKLRQEKEEGDKLLQDELNSYKEQLQEIQNKNRCYDDILKENEKFEQLLRSLNVTKEVRATSFLFKFIMFILLLISIIFGSLFYHTNKVSANNKKEISSLKKEYILLMKHEYKLVERNNECNRYLQDIVNMYLNCFITLEGYREKNHSRD